MARRYSQAFKREVARPDKASGTGCRMNAKDPVISACALRVESDSVLVERQEQENAWGELVWCLLLVVFHLYSSEQR